MGKWTNVFESKINSLHDDDKRKENFESDFGSDFDLMFRSGQHFDYFYEN